LLFIVWIVIEIIDMKLNLMVIFWR